MGAATEVGEAPARRVRTEGRRAASTVSSSRAGGRPRWVERLLADAWPQRWWRLWSVRRRPELEATSGHVPDKAASNALVRTATEISVFRSGCFDPYE